MPHARTLNGIILRVMDVGDADRFCIVFTREQGRIAARASGARKLTSRMGGVLLPFRHVALSVVETSSGYRVTAAQDAGMVQPVRSTFPSLLSRAQGIELLLALTEDEDPLPQVFDLILAFLSDVAQAPMPLTAFQLRLLHLLGFLPLHEEDVRFRSLSPEARAYVHACTRDTDFTTIADLSLTEHIRSFAIALIDEQLERPLKSGQIFAASCA